MPSLSIGEMLHVVARGFRTHPRISLFRYFELLDWAEVFRLKQGGGGPWEGNLGLRHGEVSYALLFLTRDGAEAGGRREGAEVVDAIRGREFLGRLDEGWGLIIDSGTRSEVRIEPMDLTELSETFRMKPVRQEATFDWLARVEARLRQDGVPHASLSARAAELWKGENGFGVLPNSRRGRRIARFFGPAALASPSIGDYELDPYLQHLTTDKLQERVADVLINMEFLDRTLLPHELDEGDWLELFCHIEFECRRRAVSFLEACRKWNSMTEWPRLRDARNAAAAYSGPRGKLFKFGKSAHLEAMLDRGEMRLNPASVHGDPGVRRGRRDDELMRTLLLDPGRVRVTGPGGTPIPILGLLSLSRRSPTNFYLWCTSTSFDPHLFDDFDLGYDACLIIHSVEEFSKRLFKAAEAVLPGWSGAETLVRYFDPLRSSAEVLGTFEKELRYAYQREFRFVWDPPRGEIATVLPPVSLDLGDLRDVAAILRL